jgi:hypothetical protein
MIVNRGLLITFSLIGALAIGGCGGDDDSGGGGSSSEGGGDAQAVYDKAIAGLDQLESGKVDAHVDTTLEFGDTQVVKVAEKATFDGEGGTALPKFAIEIDVEQTGGKSEHVELVNTGEAAYAKPNGADSFQNQGKQAVDALTRTYEEEQQALDEGRIPLLALTPSDWAKGPRIDGTEDVDGITAQRIVAELDGPAFLRDLETAKDNNIGMGVTLGQNARRLLEPDAKVEKAELVALVGEDDGKLRRLSANLEGDVGGKVIVDFDADLTEVDQPQTIEKP